MRNYKYTGVFHYSGHEGEKLSFSLEVLAVNFIQAFILLTAKAISEGKYYQLSWITDGEGNKKQIANLGLLENKIII